MLKESTNHFAKFHGQWYELICEINWFYQNKDKWPFKKCYNYTLEEAIRAIAERNDAQIRNIRNDLFLLRTSIEKSEAML